MLYDDGDDHDHDDDTVMVLWGVCADGVREKDGDVHMPAPHMVARMLRTTAAGLEEYAQINEFVYPWRHRYRS